MGSLISYRVLFWKSPRSGMKKWLGNMAEERSPILCRGAGRITSRALSVQWKDGSRSLAKIHRTSFSGCVFSATTSTASKKRCHQGENHGNIGNGWKWFPFLHSMISLSLRFIQSSRSKFFGGRFPVGGHTDRQ